MQPSDPAEEPTSPLDRAPPLNTAGEGGEVERPGEFIGPYKLLEVLGEGGFGVVYLAERRSPMVQRVALKVIKPGMDTRSVLARFE
jgi:serine/threonine protein kinase